MTISIDGNIRLELTAAHHASPLFDAVDKNREHLSRFMPWVSNMQSVNDFNIYIQNCESLYRLCSDVSFVIMDHDVLAGRIGIHHIDNQNKIAAIGYWLTKEAEGKGIIFNSCKELISYAFKELNLNRIEIKAAVNNLKSQAIPRKLNFVKEGILRKAELVNGEFLDLVMWGMLKEEWR